MGPAAKPIGAGLKLGALGGRYTFNARAAKEMLRRYPEFDEIVYFPTSDAAIDAALRGDVDATCAPEQTSRTGFHPGMLSRMTTPGSNLYVVGEAARRYGCSLIGKPGSSLARVQHVYGHDGSITHSRSWLESNLPGAKIEIVDTHSLIAARSVLDGDGTIASVGTPELAAEFGLLELAKDIDDGSAVNYWAVSRKQLFSTTPARLLVTGRFGDDTRLSALIFALAGTGYLLRSACPQSSGQALCEYDYMLRFAGSGSLDAVRAAVASFHSARLAGAWATRE